MKEVFFQNILIADISKKVAKWQQFSKGLNVVTGIDNHVGKSSLLKSLFYALGGGVRFGVGSKFKDLCCNNKCR